jgi:TM2 domain-containing membrane protein YozV
MKCSSCQTENQKDSRFCINCGESLVTIVPVDSGIRKPPLAVKRYAEGKNQTLAAVLSFFFTGLGQVYNGDVLKGITMFVGVLILSFTVIGALAIWAWSIVDAYQVAKGEKSLWK